MNKNAPIEFISLKPCLFDIKNELFTEFDAFKVDVKAEAPNFALVAVEVEILQIDVSNAAVNVMLDESIRTDVEEDSFVLWKSVFAIWKNMSSP